jgi:hypothetical protein
MTLCAVLLAGIPAFADEASHRAAAERLLEMTGVEQQVEMAYEGVRSSMMANFEGAGAPPEARPVFEKFLDDVLALMSETLSWENTKEDYVDIVAGHFTEDELGRLIEFYESPLGQKTLEMMPELYQRGAKIGQERFEKIKPQIDDLTDAMLDEIEEIRLKHGDTHEH